MNKIPSKVYYLKLNGEVLTITTEIQGGVEPTTKEQDFKIYKELQEHNINDIDFIELEFGTLAETFNNIKSYSIDIKNKTLNLVHFTTQELQEMQNKQNESVELNNRISDISSYLLDQQSESISVIEDFIIQTELNKVMEGMS